MSPTRANLVCAMMACAIAPLHFGCMAPGAPPAAQAQPPIQTPASAEVRQENGPEFSLARGGSAEPNLAAVFDKLQQIRAIDPAAEQKLIDELRQTPADSWPLVAEQFRASLAYREQLAAKHRRPRQVADAVQANSPPSAPIGTLVDPRHADADETSTRAESMHYAMQALPPIARAEFASDGPTYPITDRPAPPANHLPENRAPTFQQAAFETVSEPVSAADLNSQFRTNPSLAAPQAETDWQQLVRKAVVDLNDRVAGSPSTTAEVHQHVSLRMLRLLAGDTESALEAIPNISPVEQDYWSRQLFALASYLDHHSQPDDKRRAAASVTHLDEAVSHLRELGSLSLRNLSFCKNVYGYGSIEPYKDDRFAPGDEVSLYVEVENYHSQSTEKGYCTLLGSSYELLDEQGERVGGGEFPDVDDCCRTRRRDFHIQYGLTLPPKLAPGEYRLQLVVKDRQSDKIGHATASFGIRGNSSAD